MRPSRSPGAATIASQQTHSQAETNKRPNPAQADAALSQALSSHLAGLQTHWEKALGKHEYDGAWISAGEASLHFQDDHGPTFVANPYLAQWVDPKYITPGTRMLVRAGHKPTLFVHQATDYWHAPAPAPDELAAFVEIRSYADAGELLKACQSEVSSQQRLAHIGPDHNTNEVLGTPNPEQLTNYLHFHRAKKSPYEISAMRQATEVGVCGHLAAAQAFNQGATEFEIHMAFLQASMQTETELPYGNIVALNEHASVLHYQNQTRHQPQRALSLLIDAGGNYRGYASDITRTYAAADAPNDKFAALIALMEDHQLKLVASVTPGTTFAGLHEQMHRQLGDVLVSSGLVSCDAETAFTTGITEAFCPHGLGHLLGLQVHDVGGHLADEQGAQAPPPAKYPTLRFTRAVDIDHVFTVEPGLYFIPSLLSQARAENKPINWSLVDELTPYGGIRIEDNVRVLADGVENMTRDAFSRIADDR